MYNKVIKSELLSHCERIKNYCDGNEVSYFFLLVEIYRALKCVRWLFVLKTHLRDAMEKNTQKVRIFLRKKFLFLLHTAKSLPT